MRDTYKRILESVGCAGTYDVHTDSLVVEGEELYGVVLVSDPEAVFRLTGVPVDSWLLSREDEHGTTLIQTSAPSEEAAVNKLKTLLALELS